MSDGYSMGKRQVDEFNKYRDEIIKNRPINKDSAMRFVYWLEGYFYATDSRTMRNQNLLKIAKRFLDVYEEGVDE